MRRRWLWFSMLAAAWCAPGQAHAQGCVVARQSAPPAGAEGGAALANGQWQLSLGARWFRSSRHFVGTREDTSRARDGSQTINEITTAELEIGYAFHDRAWAVATLPTFVGERSAPVYAPDQRTVIARSRTSARGVGDATVGARVWLLDPLHAPRGNLAVGLSLKLPTGEPGATAPVTSATGGADVQTVDASIQPGDGGLGFVPSVVGYRSFGRVSLVASASYLMSPRETNGVPTFRPRPSEAFLSVPDAYLARAGATAQLGRGVGAGLGARLEGTPVHDLVGGDEGFRRPGYTASLEPSLTLDGGAWSASLAVPIAIARNRLMSVPERRDGVAGDAAFADFSIIIGLTHRLAAPASHARLPMDHASMPPTSVTLGGLPLVLGEGDVAPALGAKLTVVNVWATWCHACREEIPLLNGIARSFASQGVRVIGVSVDEDAAAIAPFIRDVPLTYPSYWAGPDATRALGEPTVPVTLLLDARGAVTRRIRGALTAGEIEAQIAALLGQGAR